MRVLFSKENEKNFLTSVFFFLFEDGILMDFFSNIKDITNCQIRNKISNSTNNVDALRDFLVYNDESRFIMQFKLLLPDTSGRALAHPVLVKPFPSPNLYWFKSIEDVTDVISLKEKVDPPSNEEKAGKYLLQNFSFASASVMHYCGRCVKEFFFSRLVTSLYFYYLLTR